MSTDIDIVDCFLKFQAAVKKTVAGGKGGEAAFKPSIEGSYFNALANINDSFKLMEDAIAASGANSGE